MHVATPPFHDSEVAIGCQRLWEPGRTIGSVTACPFSQIRQTPGLGLPFAAPTFNEFVVSVPDAGAALARALDAGIVGGLDLAPYAPELGPALLVCATELATRDAIDRLVQALAGSAS